MQLLDEDIPIRPTPTEEQRREALSLLSGLLGIPLVWFFAGLCENVSDLVDSLM